ncbi:hypothetical protein HYFRA_00001118 [Hymenoscyphus fraxineus]|uniref:2EXR domain-containing protein n=1 Tax=Hymenoscyphus fraxineus TaxID=746836 RepID=A0A9N9PSB7_9HELO|nr:hypothetical protein HYFRA_00001118 [Hymenoscyphus fraxineus]
MEPPSKIASLSRQALQALPASQSQKDVPSPNIVVPLTSFPRFGELAMEIRLQIFREARQPRTLVVTTYTHGMIDMPDTRGMIDMPQNMGLPKALPAAHLMVREQPQTQLPLPNRESLAELLREKTTLIPTRSWLSTPFLFNAELDTLYFTSEGQNCFCPHAWHNLLVHLANHGQKVRKIAVDLKLLSWHSTWDQHEYNTHWIHNAFRNVQEITIVVDKGPEPAASDFCLCKSYDSDSIITQQGHYLQTFENLMVMNYFRSRMRAFLARLDYNARRTWKCTCWKDGPTMPKFRQAIWEGTPESHLNPTDPSLLPIFPNPVENSCDCEHEDTVEGSTWAEVKVD